MKVKLGITDINITAKYFWNDKADKWSTLAILSELSSVYHEASEWNKEHGYESCADSLKEKSKVLYNICKDAGLYKRYE